MTGRYTKVLLTIICRVLRLTAVVLTLAPVTMVAQDHPPPLFV